MIDHPLISCIVPAFNADKFIYETLDSIYAQSYTQIEVIVVDDGSTDDTARKVQEYRPEVRYFHQDNGGPARARNLGIERSHGDMLAFLDADDLWHPEKLAKQMERFQARSDLDFCVAHIQNFWIPEMQTEAARFKDHPRSKPLPGYVAATLLARRSLFETIGSFDTTFDHADMMAWYMRASEHGAKSELLQDTLVFRRIHNLNRSRVYGKRSGSEYLHLLKSHIDRSRAEAQGSTTEPVVPVGQNSSR
jgi:glycosyltransferase involved in cell wall biosynthesis